MNTDHAFANVNGTRLFYETAGAAEAVVFIHGFTLDTRMWDDQFTPLAEHYHAIRYDMRGHGQSDKPAGPYPWPYFQPISPLRSKPWASGRLRLSACRSAAPSPCSSPLITRRT